MAAATATLSPRLSFSRDLDLSSPSLDHPTPSLPLPEEDDDFDFSVSRELQAPSPADELFSHGKLLPFSSSSSSSLNTTAIRPPPILQNATVSINQAIAAASPGNNMGRSNSVGTGSKPMLTSICPFPRSKSTGSYQTTGQKTKSPSKKSLQGPRQGKSQQQNQNARSWYGYYYSGNSSTKRSSSSSSSSSSYGNGVRINPVINVPAPFISRGGSNSSGSSSSGNGSGSTAGGGSSFFAYLLCNCRGQNVKELENFSP